MKIFDLMNLESEAYEQREKNVFFQNDLFKTRVIDLKLAIGDVACVLPNGISTR